MERSIYPQLDPLWCKVIAMAARMVPEGEEVVVQFDDTTRKKSGREIEGASYYRNGAATARQERKSVFGLNFVIGIMRLPLPVWCRGYLPIPIGLALYLKEEDAEALGRPYQTRSALARQMLERVSKCLPDREVCSVQDGAYATKAFLRERPEKVQVVSRLPVDAKLYALPVPPPAGPWLAKDGPKPKKGALLGSAKSLREAPGWQPHPAEQGAQILIHKGLWHSVLPNVVVRVVFVKRPTLTGSAAKKRHKRPLEAFFTTDLTLDAEQILVGYKNRWASEIAIRDSVNLYGLAQDGCRKYKRVTAINSLRLLFAAAQILWFVRQTQQQGRFNLIQYRPWYSQKLTPSLGDVMWACRESSLVHQGPQELPQQLGSGRMCL